MISRFELKMRWQEAFNGPFDIEEEEEYVSVLCETEWIRILAVRNNEIPPIRRIEVEVSIPPQSNESTADDIVGSDVRIFVQNLIRHLEYLLQLDEAGLTLGVLPRDGIYTAFLELENNPPDSMFDVLLPPKP